MNVVQWSWPLVVVALAHRSKHVIIYIMVQQDAVGNNLMGEGSKKLQLLDQPNQF